MSRTTIEDSQSQESSETASRAENVGRYKHEMRRFADHFASLPVATRATCPTCLDLVDAVFERAGEQVVLTFSCDRCGLQRQHHHDAIWTDMVSDVPDSPTETFGGARIKPNHRHLPRTVETLCPECAAIIVGRHFVQDSMVCIEKTCPEHGYFRDIINRDVLIYSKATWWSFEEHPGLERPHASGKNCPSDCGVCDQHMSTTCLGQVDLTNRCNMQCPICFANAGVTGEVYELTYDQAVEQMTKLRNLHPNPATALQFTGGEPTVHPDFLRLVKTAGEMGFSHIQIATNGIRLANEAFAREVYDAGLHTIYLQFDGVGDEPHEHTRNYPGLWAKKLAAIENCRKLDMKVVLVPTILKGVNDEQVGEIFRFAAANVDVVSGVSYQPVAFTGRIDEEQRRSQRYTLGDLAHDIADASGTDALQDMYPLSMVTPIAQLIEELTGQPKIRPSSHTDCGFGSYFLVSPAGETVAIPRVVNVEGLLTDMNSLARKIRRRGHPTWLDKIRTLRIFKRHYRQETAPEGLSMKLFIRSLQGMLDKKVGRGRGEGHTYKTLLCAGMHFQDRYNFDAERAKRCVILYATPDGLYPFCTFNCGPEFRQHMGPTSSSRAEPAG
jgi:7,8-dihydro-6-hydroxymethylpterin dimethyltransferase